MDKEVIELVYQFIQLRNEIKSENRFFLRSAILDDIKQCVERLTITIEKNESLWRARSFKPDDKRRALEAYLTEPLSTMLIDKFYNDAQGPFWGYDENDSYVAPGKSAVDARANPKYIPYLYTAKDKLTAISEIRPRLYSIVNVAEIKTLEDLKIYNLAIEGVPSDNRFNSFCYHMNTEFSKPVDGELEDYLLTQYFSEFIKSIGFDGIQYYSSMRGYEPDSYFGSGKCITVFNPDKCKAIGSELFKINKIEISADCIIPPSKDDSNL